MALGRVSDLCKSSFLLSKGCAAFRGRGHRRHERHAEARPTCYLCSFSDSLLALIHKGRKIYERWLDYSRFHPHSH